IYIGADDREDAKKIGVEPGDAILPICPFTPMANEKKILAKSWDNRYGYGCNSIDNPQPYRLILAKSWDNRYGCGLSIELLKELQHDTLPNELYSGATVQEEVGLRGAQSAANMIKPDIFYALDASPANDTTGDKDAFGQLGE